MSLNDVCDALKYHAGKLGCKSRLKSAAPGLMGKTRISIASHTERFRTANMRNSAFDARNLRNS
jgi:hypothetical protein